MQTKTMTWTDRISLRPWQGFLSNETAEGIAKAIFKILNGKKFTTVICHDYATKFLPRMEVVAGCELHANWVDKDTYPIKWSQGERSGINFSAAGYQMVFVSNFPSDRHPCDGMPSDRHDPYFELKGDGFAIYEKGYDGRMHLYKFQVETGD